MRLAYYAAIILAALVILIFQPVVRYPVNWQSPKEAKPVRTLKIAPDGKPIGYNY